MYHLNSINLVTVLFMLREKIENELQRLHAEGIISPVKFARWAAPIVPVLKKDNTVRILGISKLQLTRLY